MTDYISEIEPLFPSSYYKELSEKSLKIVSLSGGLGINLNIDTLHEISKLVINMNSYYSNLIEGNNTTPLEIEKAIANKLSKDPEKRSKEYEHIAHIKVQEIINRKLINEPELNICSIDFICFLHYELYNRIPEEFRKVKDINGNEVELIPGKLRDTDVKVGNHYPPSHLHIKEFLERFCNAYKPEKLSGIDKIIAAAASHHRLTWIHPFLDGNGRTARLFTHAFLIKAGVNTKNLWSVSRGFARGLNNYYAYLANADELRLNDSDGRGNLSDKRLGEFCNYFFDISIDQIEFMCSLFDFKNLFGRMKKYVASDDNLKDECFNILKEAFINGKLKRGDIPQITGLPERTARRELNKLLDKGLLKSDTLKSPVKPGFPVFVLEYYFPKLYPIT